MQNRFSLISFIALTLMWSGMIAGISFLEAPVKFTAPSLTLQVGLDVGRHVFGMFNKVEMVFSLLMIAALLTCKVSRVTIFLAIIPVLLLGLETFWLLPVLDARVEVLLTGGTPAGASPHMWYVAFELIKLLCLLIAGIIALVSLAKTAKPLS